MLSERLKLLRKENNIKQEDVADSLKISRQAYANYEVGRREPNIQILINIADYYNVSLDYLCGVTEIRTNFHKDEKLSRYINATVIALDEYIKDKK
ncbi:MAG: helix-turn-helix transcriptional regulator [Bacillota bacterium]|nr:helix-turn-helix transcriptional regulator [Bacillota bacterium]